MCWTAEVLLLSITARTIDWAGLIEALDKVVVGWTNHSILIADYPQKRERRNEPGGFTAAAPPADAISAGPH